MKKPIFTFLVFVLMINIIAAQSTCALDGPSIACVGEKVSIQFDSEEVFDEVRIDAFTVLNGTQELAISENKTNSSADIIFLSGGDSEIVVRFLNNNTLVAICNLNVFVFDGDPIPALGQLSNFIGDQVTCESLDLAIDMFINCTECPFYWTLNDDVVELDQQTSINGPLQIINANLLVDGIGSYTFCQNILKPDSTCFVEDCISIDIVALDQVPSFSLNEEESIFCLGTTLEFNNETIVEEDVIYIWEIVYDSLQWRFIGQDLAFDFLFAGNYTVSLQYVIERDNNCVSEKISMDIEISDAPIIPITCSSNSCKDSIFTYQAPVECENFEWIIDESLGSIISNDTSGVTIKWNPVDQYTETKITLLLNTCSQNACNETFRNISLYPANLRIEGAKGICDRGAEWYETDLIPNATYSWEIEMIDSIAGTSPNIIKVEDNRVLIAYNSYLGNLDIKVNVSIPSKDCQIDGTLNTASLLISSNDNLCLGDLFKASIIPKLDQEVIWTLFNSEFGYLNQQTLSGQNDFFAFDFNTAGMYSLDLQIPALDFTCDEDIQLTALEQPEVSLIGPLFICPGDSATYTLNGLGANDDVEWTILQNNTTTNLSGNEITILWEEGGAPYTIKVSRTTEVMVDQFCESESFLFEIGDIQDQVIEVTGPEVVCYDGQGIYQIIDFPGTYIWEIDPPFMGTIIEGDSTEMISIQWHYAPNTPFATLSTERVVCGEKVKAEIEVFFEPFLPELSVPDTVCRGNSELVELIDLYSYETIAYYLNDSLVREDRLFHNYNFQDTGWVEIKVDVVNPNDCPGFSSVSKLVYVKTTPNINFILSAPLKQCPKESFENVIINIDYLDPEAYYIWSVDDLIIKEGLGAEDLYTFTITKEMIDTAANSITLSVDNPELCLASRSLPLGYVCEEIICACLEDVIGSVDYLTPLECNLASFGGSLDLSTVISPYWQIALTDTVIIIPINNVEDLTQDSFYFDEDRTIAQVALLGTCDGANYLSICGVIQPEPLEFTQCDIFIDEQKEDLYVPDFVREYICNEDLTYDIIFTEKSLRNSNPPFNSTVSWMINGIQYDGVSILIENVVGGSELDMEITRCSLDGTYCCTKQYTATVRDEFSPNIILPNGSCENDIWLFSLDVNANSIVSALWDFGDGSGSTLISTTKGFLDTLEHDISVVVTDNVGCVATAETTVKSFPNIIDGEIIFESDPCASSALLTYVENSTTTIADYNWNVFNSPDSASIEVFNSGDYLVTVTDIHGCVAVTTVGDIQVNESFVGGLRYKTENCGAAVASILPNDDYSYQWYVDGEAVSTANNIQLVTPGAHEILVISTSLNTNEICDSIVGNLVIYPLPEKPFIEEERIFCDPFIIELSLLNYPSAEWTIENSLKEEGASIFVSQNGSYTATVVDENGCVNKTTKNINEAELPFGQLLDQCIQACREDLDSLSISIPGLDIFASEWTWVTVDSLGIEYEVSPSSGFITPLTITSDMYDYVQLQIVREECTFRSERIPLDITICNQPNDPEPPDEIECEPIDSDHASCGQSIYKCLVSEVNGGPKLYFEGSVTLPMGAVLCTEDSLNVSLNNGHITITDVEFEELDGKIMAFYSANIMISDPEDYKENGTIIKFDFCNEEGDKAFCYEYNLPFRSCGKDFNCLIDFEGISSGQNQTVEINYCLNLSEVVQVDCTLSEYTIEAILSGDETSKTVFIDKLVGGFDKVQCIAIPVTMEDFYGGEFNCIELLIDGNCPGIRCSEYQCGFFGSSSLVGSSINTNAIERVSLTDENSSSAKEDTGNPTFVVYPNPSNGLITFEFEGNGNVRNYITKGTLMIKNSMGQTIKTSSIGKTSKIKENLVDQKPGLYIATWIDKGVVIASKRFVLLN